MQIAYDLAFTTYIQILSHILDDMMLIRPLPWKVGHDLDLKVSF